MSPGSRFPLCNTVKKKWEAQNSSTSHDRAEQWLKGLTMSELRDAQLADDNIRPVVQWKESKEGRPEWPKVASENPAVKSYLAQWDRLSLQNGVLYRRWESECGDNEYWQLVVPVSCRLKRCSEEITQRPHFWTPGDEENTRPCERTLLLEWVQS